jgi:peptidoglycan/xylan/chitin deacetylase (PgdA/CDA1 family)
MRETVYLVFGFRRLSGVWKGHLLPLVILLIILFGSQVTPAYGMVKNNYVTLVFRYDDYSSKSATSIDKEVIELFKKHHLAFTIGVVPFIAAGDIQEEIPERDIPLTQAKIAILRRALRSGTVDIALHGYSHHNFNQGLLRKPSEFAGVDYESQLLKLRAGRRFLEKHLGVNVDVFIPPFDTYDTNTLWALEKLHFRCIAAKLSGVDLPSTNLDFLPYTCELPQLRAVLKRAEQVKGEQPIVCVVFHEFSFSEIKYATPGQQHKISFAEFAALLQWITHQKAIKVKTIDQLIKEHVDLSVGRFINNKYYLRLAHLKPAAWPPYFGYYLPISNAYPYRIRNMFNNLYLDRIKDTLYVASFYGIILAGFWLLFLIMGLIVFRFVSIPVFLSSFLKYSIYLLILSGMLYGIFITKIRYTVLIPLASLLGILAGLWVAAGLSKYRHARKLENGWES